ncbi:hypothetical protein L3X38_003159 [Prunus dulcis]|uniref:Uncharacterized protein n=1 Tax=Prunus dulcis TaxID=3755 RepID=A0AAD5F1J1_PRUDU|nr:hypothetical protein L3X38_003159 [Prunus dulcis]
MEDSGDHSQPDPLAGLGDTQSTQAATGRIQGTVVNLIRNPGRSRDTKSIRAVNSGTHGLSVSETREANVKCTDKTEATLRIDLILPNRQLEQLERFKIHTWIDENGGQRREIDGVEVSVTSRLFSAFSGQHRSLAGGGKVGEGRAGDGVRSRPVP